MSKSVRGFLPRVSFVSQSIEKIKYRCKFWLTQNASRERVPFGFTQSVVYGCLTAN